MPELGGRGQGGGEVRGDKGCISPYSHWRTLRFYSKRDGQPLEDITKNRQTDRPLLNSETDGLFGGSLNNGRTPCPASRSESGSISPPRSCRDPKPSLKGPREESEPRGPATRPCGTHAELAGRVQILASRPVAWASVHTVREGHCEGMEGPGTCDQCDTVVSRAWQRITHLPG